MVIVSFSFFHLTIKLNFDWVDYIDGLMHKSHKTNEFELELCHFDMI